jgi:hypothetical protein
VARVPPQPPAGAVRAARDPTARLPGALAGSIAEIRRKDDELEVEVDGALVERIVGDKDFSVDRPVFRFRLNGTEFEETLSASPAALRALADFRDRGGTPPWEHASELLADGLIDVHFDLTPRGRRAVARFEQEQ